MGLILRLLVCLLLMASQVSAQVQSFPPSGGSPVGQSSPCTTPGDVLTTSAGVWICAQPPGAGTGAPVGAAYWTRVSDATLTNESNMAALASGLVLNTTSTGVPSIYGGTGTFANQFIRSLNAMGVATPSPVTLADINVDLFTQAEADAHTGATTNVHGIPNTDTLLKKDGSITADFLAIMDTDATPVANRRWMVIDGRLISTNTSAVEGPYISRNSIETLVAANYQSASVTKPKLVYGSTAGDASTLTIHDLISGSPSTGQCVQWNGTNWIAASCGTGGGGTAETTTFTPAGPIAATNVEAAILEAAAEAIQTSTKDVAGGVAGLGSGAGLAGKLIHTEIGSTHTHNALAAANSITVAALEEGIAGSTPLVDLTNDPQIVDGVDGQLAFFPGTSQTNTVKLDNGNGLRLCGNKGSTIVGLDGEKPLMRYNAGLDVWEELICPSLQKTFNVNPTMYGASDLASALRVGTDPNTFCAFYGATIECYVGGAPTDVVRNVPSGKSDILQVAGSTYETVNAASGYVYSNAGRPRGTIYWDAAAIRPDGTQCVAVSPTVNSGPVIDGITCAENAAAKLSVKLRLPDRYTGGDLYCRLTAHDVDSSGHVSGWDARAQCRTPGTDTINATWGTAVNMDVTMTTANIPYSNAEATITPNGGCLGGDMLFLELNMDTTANTDDGDAVIEGLTCEFLQGSRSD